MYEAQRRMMARKSKQDLITSAVVGIPSRSVEPPSHLTEDQADIWRMVMGSTCGAMITEDAYPVLVEYCRVISRTNMIAKELDSFGPGMLKTKDGIARWKSLSTMSNQSAKLVMNLATKLRITPQSRVWKQTAGRLAAASDSGASIGRKPWQFEVSSEEQ